MDLGNRVLQLAMDKKDEKINSKIQYRHEFKTPTNDFSFAAIGFLSDT